MNMEKYTKEQRKEIYLKAAEYLKGDRDPLSVCCYALNKVTGKDVWTPTATMLKLFPEFEIFKPYEGAYRWWNECQDNIGVEKIHRINALLLSAAMCENTKS